MVSEEAILVGVGMMTAVGLSAAETAASVRAGIMRFVETAGWTTPWSHFAWHS